MNRAESKVEVEEREEEELGRALTPQERVLRVDAHIGLHDAELTLHDDKTFVMRFLTEAARVRYHEGELAISKNYIVLIFTRHAPEHISHELFSITRHGLISQSGVVYTRVADTPTPDEQE